jgi:hypothetical protein
MDLPSRRPALLRQPQARERLAVLDADDFLRLIDRIPEE